MMLDNIVIDYTKVEHKVDPAVLPHRYEPYMHQNELVDTFFDMLEGENELKRFGLEWHRRAGKDMTFWQLVVAAAISEAGDYAYMLPTNKQAMKVIWNSNVNDKEQEPCKFFDFIPTLYLSDTNKGEQRVELTNGSNIYIIGSDNYDSNVGMNVKGVVYSEWSLCDPRAHAFFEPMLLKHAAENSKTGWALFCWTPRGKNHAYDTRNNALKEINKNYWYFSSLDITKTFKVDGTPLITREAIDKAIEGGADPDLVQQEYYLDYAAAVKGVVFAQAMKRSHAEGRVVDMFSPDSEYKFDPKLPVMFFFDIGMGDATSLWAIQKPRDPKDKNLYAIDYYESNRVKGGGMEHYVEYINGLKEQLGFKFISTIYLPHDGKVHEWGSGETRVASLTKHFPRVKTIERISRVENGIYQTQSIFHRVIFDVNRCKQGIICLENYKYKMANGVPNGFVHDEYSHGADSFRQMGQLYGVLPDEARDALADELSNSMNEGIADDYETFNPLKR